MPVKSPEPLKDQAGAMPHSDGQIQKLVEVISRSQHGYRELIDNLDQAVFTLSAEGEVQVANRYLSDLLGISFQELIGHRLADTARSGAPASAASKREFVVRHRSRAIEEGRTPPLLSLLASIRCGGRAGRLHPRLGPGRDGAA